MTPQQSIEAEAKERLISIKKEVALEMGFDLNTDVYKIHFSNYCNEIAKRFAVVEKISERNKTLDEALTIVNKFGLNESVYHSCGPTLKESLEALKIK